MSKQLNIPIGDISIGKKKRFEISGKKITVYHLQDGWFALDDECTHKGASLVQGVIIDDNIIECPRHGARFDIKTGKVLALPATHPLKTYKVLVEGDEVVVMIEDDECCGGSGAQDGCCGGQCGCGKNGH